MKTIYHPSERKVYTDEDYMRRMRRNVLLSVDFEDFYSSLFFCAYLAIHEEGGKTSILSIDEIKKLANLDLNNRNLVGKVYAKYFGKDKNDVFSKKNTLAYIKEQARVDLKTLDFLKRQGINGIKELESWFEEKKYPLRPVKS